MTVYLRSAWSIALLLLLGIVSCAAPAQPSSLGERPTDIVPLAPTQPADDEEAIRQLIEQEAAALVSQDLAGLMALWAEDAVIVDAKHTPDDEGDDARWRGRDAIRERYVVLVLPGNPLAAGARDIRITVEGDTATATSTTAIGDEVAVGGDRWTFVRRGGRWSISGLTYNLEP